MIVREKSASDGNDITKRIAGITPNKKNIVIDQLIGGNYFVKFRDGGQLPRGLKGRFTQYEYAQHAVDAYLAGK